MSSKLSLNKLEQFITSNGLKINRYYRAKKYCVYVDAITMQGSRVFISIPRNYKIRIDEMQGYNIYPFNIEDLDDIEKDIDNKGYSEIDIMDCKDYGKESNIIKSYKGHSISIDSIDSDKQILQKMLNFINRIKYCYKNLRYKVGICNKNYLCTLERDKSIDLYYIKKYKGADSINMYIIVDLEMFYEKTEKNTLELYSDLKNIEDQTYNILDKIQLKYVDMLSPENENMREVIADIIKRKKQYNSYLDKFYILGETNLKNIENLKEKVENIDNQRGNNRYKENILIQEKMFIQDKIKDNTDTQIKLRDSCVSVRDKNNNIYVLSDMAIYDNMVLADDIYKNLNVLQKSLNIK